MKPSHRIQIEKGAGWNLVVEQLVVLRLIFSLGKRGEKQRRGKDGVPVLQMPGLSERTKTTKALWLPFRNGHAGRGCATPLYPAFGSPSKRK